MEAKTTATNIMADPNINAFNAQVARAIVKVYSEHPRLQIIHFTDIVSKTQGEDGDFSKGTLHFLLRSEVIIGKFDPGYGAINDAQLNPKVLKFLLSRDRVYGATTVGGVLSEIDSNDERKASLAASYVEEVFSLV